MTAISVSVETSTVFVCKNLAEAQFRCVECCKAFISGRHLAKHNHKRHGLTSCFITDLVQTDKAHEQEQKLNEVTGRLEKAVLLLEAKTSSLGSTTFHDRPEDNVREALEDVNVPQYGDKSVVKSANEANEAPLLQKNMEVRRIVSLFTLPNHQVGGWMTPLFANEGSMEMDMVPIGDVANKSEPDDLTRKFPCHEDTQKLFMPDPSVEREPIPDEVTDGTEVMSANDDSENIPRGGPDQEVECIKNDQTTASVEPLLVELIEKLDKIFIGNRLLMNSGCQTSDAEMPANQNCPQPQLESDSLNFAPGRKSVRFSDSPMYYGSSEHHFESEPESSSGCSETKSDEEGADFIERDKFQAYTYSAQSDVIRPVYRAPESAEGTQFLESCSGLNDVSGDDYFPSELNETSDIKQDVRNTQCEVEAERSCSDQEESEEDCSQSATAAAALPPPVTAPPAVPPPAAAAVPPPPAPADPPRNPQPSTTTKTNSQVRLSADYVATKKQILDIVEKCVKDLKEKRKHPKSSSLGLNQNRGVTNSSEMKNSSPPNGFETANQGSPEKRLTSTSKSSPNVICVGNENVTVESQGILPPCTVICKDEEVDIDELSGDSYERFMKRFCSRTSEPKPGHDQSPSNQHQRDQNHEMTLSHQNETQTNLDPQNGNNTGWKPPKDSELKKTEYAVLLHHETSQVQELIDTLVTDLQRWRRAKRDHLSHAIRLQLEERLASNLNLLGIQSNANLLSDSAAATAHCLLNTRRTKSAKVSPSSYCDVLKYAFMNEVDRIAKSRMNAHSQEM